MNRLLALGLFAWATALSAAEHIEDPGKLLPAGAAQAAGGKLAEFERATGIKVLVRYHAKSPTPEEDKVPGAYMQALARKLGTLQRGVLMVYFADDPDWRVWIGDELTPAFAGKPGTVKELTDSDAIHDAKEAMLTAAKAKADADFAGLRKVALTRESPAGMHLALQTDALLDALMKKFPPPPR